MMASAARVGRASTSTVYIGIGSNLGQPLEQIRRARDALAELPKTRLVGISPLYRNPAVGPGEQPDYVNAVAAIETRLSPMRGGATVSLSTAVMPTSSNSLTSAS